jgi:ubiquinone/menaquinone biosynthesis C-methylase UbiE
VAYRRPARILETAAGTGIVTRAVHDAVPEAQIVATDVNQTAIEFAAQRHRAAPVTFRRADAQDLPFEDQSFDLVLCLFGVMFFPDKVRAHAEARRVLRTGGQYVLATFDSLDDNPIPRAAGRAVASLFSEDPRYMERGPFSYTDPSVVERHLRAAGFDDVQVATLRLASRVTAHRAAEGIVLGSPFRTEIERLGPSALQQATAAVTEALLPWDGTDATMSAHIATATR